jgi:hypothetical protein
MLSSAGAVSLWKVEILLIFLQAGLYPRSEGRRAKDLSNPGLIGAQ